MKVLVVLCAIIAISFALNEEEYRLQFKKFVVEHEKTYEEHEFQHRYAIFKENVDYINSKNAENNGMTLSVNKFADLTNLEFQRLYLAPFMTAPLIEDQIATANSTNVGALPTAWDWVSKGAVTGIKNQGQCGSCWSFSTTGSTEGCHFLKTGKLVGLSEQNLMDCSTSYGDNGCDGGLMTDAMQYIISNGGIDTEASYPYTSEDGTSCQYKSANSGATLASFTNVKQGDEKDLQEKSHLGPVSVAIDASHQSFQFYTSGVYYEPACSSTQLDHGVLVVGWGVDNAKDYWIVKNSWGTDWGINGYIWMTRNKNNNCGIATTATLPHC